MPKKSQSSFEFVLIITLFIFVLAIFMVFFDSRLETLDKQRNYDLLANMGKTIESEIKLASTVEDGYQRTFFLNDKIDRKKFYITYKNGDTLGTKFSVFALGYEDKDVYSGEYVFFSVPNITGTFNHNQKNTLIKEKGKICINTC